MNLPNRILSEVAIYFQRGIRHKPTFLWQVINEYLRATVIRSLRG